MGVDAGAVEGRNVSVDYVWVRGEYQRVPEILVDFVRRRVAVIVTPGLPRMHSSRTGCAVSACSGRTPATMQKRSGDLWHSVGG